MNRIRAACLAVALALAGCQRAEQESAAPAATPAQGSAAHVEGIAWFDGDINSALAAAAEQHKLVFLYWGAEWCPPCHELKAHVFSRPDFQEKLRQFVPVYLDGDAPSAQRTGEQYQVMGYPTAVVLKPDGGEIARIASGQDLTSYADLLDLALENVQPLPELLAALRKDDGRTLSEAECRRFAWNSWGLDPRIEGDELLAALELAAARCPEKAALERDRLLVMSADLAASSEVDAVKEGRRAGDRLVALVDAVQAMLADRERSLANADALLSLGEDFFVVARRVAPGRTAQLQDGWFALMDAIETDARFSDTMQLQSAARRLVAARALDADGKVPEEVAKRARATLDAFLARDYDADARSAIVNSASWVYTYLDDDAGLRALLDKQIAASKTPYYYYPDIADLEEKAGHKAEALNWLERGYKESKGPATRFQWGALYLNGLLRLAPQEEPRIRAAVLEVLGELDGPDRIHARARSRLDKLDAALGEWAKKTKNGATLTAIGEYWKQVCAGLPETDPVRNECPGLLVAART